jgi:hypothetical protein
VPLRFRNEPYRASIRLPQGSAQTLTVDFGAAAARLREAVEAAPLRRMPLYVNSRGKPVQVPPGPPRVLLILKLPTAGNR